MKYRLVLKFACRSSRLPVSVLTSFSCSTPTARWSWSIRWVNLHIPFVRSFLDDADVVQFQSRVDTKKGSFWSFFLNIHDQWRPSVDWNELCCANSCRCQELPWNDVKRSHFRKWRHFLSTIASFSVSVRFSLSLNALDFCLGTSIYISFLEILSIPPVSYNLLFIIINIIIY